MKDRKTAKEIAEIIRTVGNVSFLGNVNRVTISEKYKASFYIQYDGAKKPFLYFVSSVKKGNMIKKELEPYLLNKII